MNNKSELQSLFGDMLTGFSDVSMYGQLLFKEVARYCDQIDHLKNEISNLHTRINSLEDSVVVLKDNIYKKSGEITDLHTRINSLEHLLELTRSKND